MKKIKVFLMATMLIGITIVGTTVVNAWQNRNPYVYFSDQLLRNSIVDKLQSSGTDIANELPTAEQMQTIEGEYFSWEIGRSIEGIQYLPKSIISINGSESDVRDLSPIYEGYNEYTGEYGMNHLSTIVLNNAYVVDEYELQEILYLEALEHLVIYDSNSSFKDFGNGLSINDNLKELKYYGGGTYPTQTISKSQEEFSLKSPILLQINQNGLLDGKITYSSKDAGFSVDNDLLKWDLKQNPDGYLRFSWKYEYKENNRDFELTGTVGVSLNKI